MSEAWENGPDRTGPWVVNCAGRRWYPLDPRPEDFDIKEIAHHLSMIPRFNGATRSLYSVAQHSVYCSWYVADAKYSLDALLHDAAEAVIGDMVKPLKETIPSFGFVEDRIYAVIAKKFGACPVIPDAVKAIDRAMLMTEAAIFFADIPEENRWFKDGPFVSIRNFAPWGQQLAEAQFMSRFAYLTAVRDLKR